MKTLTEKAAKKHGIKRKPAKSAPKATTKKAKPAAKPKDNLAEVKSLVVTVADLVKTTAETNTQAMALIDRMALRVGTVDNPPVAQPNAKKWRFTVAERDKNGFLKTVDAERME